MTGINPFAPDDPNALRGRRVLLMGLGTRQGGVGVARYLCAAGAKVRVTDLRAEADLADSIAELNGLPIEFTLGRHEETDFVWADVVVRNPAVPRESPWLMRARDLGKRVETEMTLFFRACRAPIAGVTGTKGKSTTTAVLHAILRERWPSALLAGNMGRSALDTLPLLAPEVPIAIELSSFQLEALDEHRQSPHVAVLTNISQDHLDRYASFEDYADVKAAIAKHHSADDWLIIPSDDPVVHERVAGAAGCKVSFGVVDSRERHSLWIESGQFMARWDGELIDIAPVFELRVPGDHSRMNVLAAAGAALALGVPPGDIRSALRSFAGVADRLESLGTIDGVEYVNDTTATAPAAAIAALKAYAGRELVVIAGGSDKLVALDEFARELARCASQVVLLDGGATPRLAALLAAEGYMSVEGPVGDMRSAVDLAAAAAREPSVVLLSPGCASFGMFRDEFHRGAAFREAVALLKDATRTREAPR